MKGDSSSCTSGNDTDTSEDASTPGLTVDQPVTGADGKGVVSGSPVPGAECNMDTSSGQQPQQHSPRTPLSAGADNQPGPTAPQIHEKIPSPTTLSKPKLPSLPGMAPHISGSIGDMATPALLPPLSTKTGDWKVGVSPSAPNMEVAPPEATDGATTPMEHDSDPRLNKGQPGNTTKGSGNGSSADTPKDKSTTLSRAKPSIEATRSGATAGLPVKGVNRRSSTFRSAAMAVMAVKDVQHYRRGSAALHTDLLRAFVPDMLIRCLENASKPLESQAFFVRAACMCADISGFTALSEKHCKQGTAGLDTLVQIINSYYSNLVNIVYSFGGDIIKIAGDALYCVFMPDEHDIRGAVLCAALCSMQLRDVAADGLTLHVGISCGELCFAILGGIDNYWECLMSGEPIGLVADALDEAKKQEVVVSSECLAIIGDCCRGTPLPSRNVLLKSMEPPRREKRGSIRVATMIANKGLHVELEPVKGLFANGTPESAPNTSSPATSSSAISADSVATTRAMVPPAGGASAAWLSSNAKARDARDRAGSKGLFAGGKGKRSDPALGAAGKMRVEASAGVLPLLEGFVPGPVTDMLEAGIFMYMAEMRTVTTLFVKLDSYSPEKHKNLLSLQIHLTTIQKILAEHGGFLRQFLVDDKGCVLIACWGVPGRSYPDNGNRCLAAAVEMHASLLVKDMKTSMGVTTGHALCGRVGGKIRSEYAMVGDVINLAARLMGKAKGRIVCDETTHDLVCSNDSALVLFKRLDPMMLKGKEKPIAPYVCLAQQGSDMWDTLKQLRMIGRMNLQNAVNAQLDILGKTENGKAPKPGVVIIEGAHGTGKTMVADRVKKSASQFFKKKVYMYSMPPTLSGVPYAGAKGMLRTMFGLDHLGDDALGIKNALLQVIRRVYGTADDTTTNVAIAALKAVLGVDVSAETEGQIIQASRTSTRGKVPMHAIHSVISELVTHAWGSDPAVFILDNVHQMDEMSWKLLMQFMQYPWPLLFVLTATPVEEGIRKRKNLSRAKKKNHGANTGSSKAQGSDVPNLVWHGEHGETHVHMQQYIRATQLLITEKFSLPPFSKDELGQLLQYTLPPQDKESITDELVDTVYGLSGGNPYWCVEVVRFIKENSVGTFMARISVPEQGGEGDGAGGGNTGSAEEAMMDRMGILVVCRFERLLVEEQSVVRYASVAGVEFSTNLLHFVLPRNIRPQLELIIQALVTARFLVHSRHTYYKFRNSMVHMVLYNLTPASSRKRMHKAVADYYMNHHSEDPLYLPVMTYHLLQAQVKAAMAVDFLCRTAAHALVHFCYENCMEGLEKAVELVSSTSEIHEVMVVLHHVSVMHERGHTAKMGNTQPAGQAPDARSDSIGQKSGASDGRGGSGYGGRRVEATGSAVGRAEGTLFDPDAAVGNGSACGSTSVERCDDDDLRQALEYRIEKLKLQSREAHSRLCHAGESCPTLRGKFTSTIWKKAADEYLDTPSKDEDDSSSSTDTPAARSHSDEQHSRENNSNFHDEDNDLDDEWGEGAEGRDGGSDGSHRTSPAKSEASAAQGEDAHGETGGTGEGSPGESKKTDSAQSWRRQSALQPGVAHMLNEKLAQYMVPGAASPECPKSLEVDFSTTTHRLPPEPGGGDPLQGTEDEEDSDLRDEGRNNEDDRPDRISTLRSKVSSAALLLTETSSRALRGGVSIQGKPFGEARPSAIGSSVVATLSKAATAASKTLQVLSPKATKPLAQSFPLPSSSASRPPGRGSVSKQGRTSLAPLAVFRQPTSGQGALVPVETDSGHQEQAVGGASIGEAKGGGGVVGEPSQAVDAATRERDSGSSRVCVIS